MPLSRKIHEEMKLFYKALLRSKKMPAVDKERKKRSCYVKKCPKRLYRDVMYTNPVITPQLPSPGTWDSALVTPAC